MRYRLLYLLLIFALLKSPSPVQAKSPITLQNANTLKEVGHLGRGVINDIAWLPDAKLLAAATASGLWIYDAANFKQPARHFPSGNLTSLEFSSDSKSVISGGTDGQVLVWDVTTGKQTKAFRGNGKPIVDISLNGDVVAIARGPVSLWNTQTNPINLWDIKTNVISKLSASNATNITFRPHSNTLAVLKPDGNIEFWNTFSNKLEKSHSVTLSAFNLDYSADGTIFTVGEEDDHVYVFDAETIGYLDGAYGFDRMYLATLSANGSLLACGTVNGEIGVYKLRGESLGFAKLQFYFIHGLSTQGIHGHDDTGYSAESGPVGVDVTSLEFSSDNELLASVGADGVLRIWDIDKEIQVAALENYAVTSDIGAMVFSPDDQLLSIADDGNVFRQWNVSTEEQVSFQLGKQLYSGGGMWPRGISVALSPDATLVARGHTLDGAIELWNLPTQKTSTLGSIPGDAKALAISQSGQYLAAAGLVSDIFVWNLIGGKQDTVYSYENMGQYSVLVFSPDDKWLAAGSENGNVLWFNAGTGKPSYKVELAKQFIKALAFSPDNKRLASGSTTYGNPSSSSICFWDVYTGKKLRCLNISSGIDALTFSPDGNILASVYTDNTLRLWNVNSGRLLATYDTKGGSIVKFSHDGTLIAVSGYDGIMRLWGLASSDK